MIKIYKKDFDKFIKNLQKNFDVFAPVTDGKAISFQKISKADEINNKILNTKKSPKSIFFPQSEVLFQYTDDGMQVPERNERPFAVWGMRNCDVRSLLMLDSVFGKAHQEPNKEMYKDPYWKEKYDNCLVFSLGCNEPLSTCFCHWFDGGPFDKTGSDIFVWETDNSFLLEAVSEKGNKFLKTLQNEKATQTEIAEVSKLKEQALPFLNEKQDTSTLFDKAREIWDEPVWDEIAAKCINCGGCTFVCPTCHCFDVSDEGKGKKGKRIRLWDSCMFSIFTKEASGHNPRSQSTQRVRQRIMHKYNYFKDNYGTHLCTGCGRCITVCPVNLDIREVIKKIINY